MNVVKRMYAAAVEKLSGQKRFLASVGGHGWFPVVRESFTGAWQQNVEVRPEQALANPTVYACITQIAGDVGKLRLRLTERMPGEIWEETDSAAFSPVLRKPNPYQTRQKFIEQWVLSKLTHGNFYGLKRRDNRGVVEAIYPLDPNRCKPLVADDGEVFYELQSDNLSKLREDSIVVPAREIIHDRMECLFHPLVGIPPMFAGGLAAMQGINIQNNSAKFFGNDSRPGGVLTAPGKIAPETAQRLKAAWEENYGGANYGRVAILGDDLKYEPIAVNANDAQLIEQLRWSDEKICSVFKVPPYKVYVGPMPTYQNAEVLDRIYYSGCLQRLIESIEASLDEGLALPARYGTEFDLDDLMRMDTSMKMKTAAEAIGAGVMAPNEARRKFNLPPVDGGESPYLQQQNYSLSALAMRDALNPLADPGPNPGGTVAPAQPEPDETREALNILWKRAPETLHAA
jgi:HK97 family phage portal protein